MSDQKPPERIWLQYHEPEGDQIRWERDQIHDSDVEYQRTPPPEEAEPVGKIVGYTPLTALTGPSLYATVRLAVPERLPQGTKLFLHPPQPPEGELLEFVRECAKLGYKDSNPESLLEWVARRARKILDGEPAPEGEAERDRKAMEDLWNLVKAYETEPHPKAGGNIISAIVAHARFLSAKGKRDE